MAAEILIWAPNRAKFVAALLAARLPDGESLAREETIDGERHLLCLPGLNLDEIGAALREPACYDETGDREIAPARFAVGHHVNVLIDEPLFSALERLLPAGETFCSRLAASGLLGAMKLLGRSRTRPAGWAGRTGVRIFDPGMVGRRTRVWAR